MLVGRSHWCDAPEALDAPVLTAPHAHMPGDGADPRAIDDVARALARTGKALSSVDAQRLADLRPDLILTQDDGPAGAADLAPVRRVAADLRASGRASPTILGLNPHTLEDVLDDLIRIGQATGLEAPATGAALRLHQRLLDAQSHVNPYDDGPVVGFLAWTDPLVVAGHWTVQMIERAGGRHPLNPTRAPDDCGAAAGLQQGARRARGAFGVTPGELGATMPAWLVIAPCGLGLEASWRAVSAIAQEPWFRSLPAVRRGRVAVVDGDRMFNRPGPRLAEAFEWLVSWVQDRPDLAPAGFPWRAWTVDAVESGRR